MRNIREIYTDEEKFRYGCSYEELLDSFDYENLIQVDDNDYQGDSRILYKDGDRYGWLQFGWGSCSGCDAAQGVESIKEAEELQISLHESIRWFDSKTEALEFFQTHDWNGDYSWHSKEQKEFVAKVIEILSQ